MKYAGKQNHTDRIHTQIKFELIEVREAEESVAKAFSVLNESLIALNNVNAKYGRGAVDVEDLLFHSLLPQEEFDKAYKKKSAQALKEIEESERE